MESLSITPARALLQQRTAATVPPSSDLDLSAFDAAAPLANSMLPVVPNKSQALPNYTKAIQSYQKASGPNFWSRAQPPKLEDSHVDGESGDSGQDAKDR